MGTNTELVLYLIVVGCIVSTFLAFLWVAIRLGPKGRGHGGHNHGSNANELMTDEMREKIRQQGIARFERTLDQNATFLQKDLQKVSDEVTEFIKERAGDILKEEFADQKQIISSAQQHVAESYKKLDTAIIQQHKILAESLQNELLAEKERRLERFQDNIAEVITGHILSTLGENLEVSDQIKFIISNLEENKQSILEDLKREL